MMEMQRLKFRLRIGSLIGLVSLVTIGSVVWAGAPAPKAVEFKTSLSAPQIIDGGLGVVDVELPEDWAQSAQPVVLTGKLKEKVFPLYSLESQSAKQWQGLFGVPYGQPAGPLKLELTAKRADEIHTWEVEFTVIDGKYRSETLKVSPKHVNPPKSALARIKRDGQEARQIYATVTPTRDWNGPFKRPMSSPLTSDYGAKRVYNGELKSAHKGVDFKAAAGSKFYAPAAGKVVLARDLYFSGNTVILDHGYGLYTVYMHLSRFKAKKGTVVKSGDLLGWTGATGRVTGPHLHWGAVVHGEKINPLELTTVIQ